MSLIKKHEMTEKQLAANRRNQKLSHGPATAEGRERIRAALLRFGFNAQAEEVAMRALGEDPARFQELLEGLWEEYNPVGASQEGVVIRLARATWLMNRADRMQEGYALRQAKDVSSGREDRLHAQMMRLKMTAARLQSLAQSVAREHYVTTPTDLDLMKNLHQEGVVKEMGEIALAHFYQLREPGAPGPGEPDEAGQRQRSEAQARAVLVRIKEIFGLYTDPETGAHVAPASNGPQQSQQDAQAGVAPDFSPAHADLPTKSGQVPVGATQPEEEDERYPNLTAAEWQAREPVRQLLENILTRQGELCDAQRKAILKECLAGPSPHERAAEIAPAHRNATLMRRMQDSNFRQVVRLTSLLMRMKRHERQMEALERDGEKHGGADL